MDPSIFKAYDIRGTYPDQLNADFSKQIGLGYASLIRSELQVSTPKIVVGMDMRLSGPELKRSLIEGLTQGGCDVVDIGLASTPTFYFAVGHYGYDGGVQVSASHNPKEYNGFKLVRAKAVPISGDSGMYDLRDIVVKGNFSKIDKVGRVVEKKGVIDDLVADQTKGVDLSSIKSFKVVVDPANAMGSICTSKLFEKLPCRLIKLNFELDGTFPSHEADPLKDKNNEQLIGKVLEEKADFGIAIDGDGDRVFVITEDGRIMSPSILRGVLAQMVLRKNPGSKIIYDIRPGKITVDLIKEAGGIPLVTRVGHSLIKEKMIEEDSPFSGESSGHFFYKFDYGSFEAPVRMMVDFLTWLGESDKSLSERIKKYERYFHSGEINSLVDDPDEKINLIKSKYADGDVNEMDGVTVTFDDFWFNVRKSNTEPKLRFALEAVSKELMEEKREEILKVIRSN